ncbi:olfactory receptor 1361-like [Gracilinanus agilis]|uniref:olfactory receptor 1361-like n=1 Tax=Gracilinanus agilis TaxID=191870 RepID=UPI001CFDBDBC|nr:olfactory receptor 1361-like [Gracilinanus agilis]
MDRVNWTSASEFLLLGLSEQPIHQPLIFGLFLSVYLVTVTGNMLIVLAITCDARLHTPMYFFLTNLSLTDIASISTTVPKMLENIWTEKQTISYVECLTQLYFSIVFVTVDNFLLATMAYDRYVAICRPLHYATAMSPGLCVLMATVSWGLTNLIALVHILLLDQLQFCRGNIVPHFFCDMPLLLQLACSDTHLNQLLILVLGGSAILLPFVLILASYVRIIMAIFKVPAANGRWKAFSTCGSHLTVVTMFYGTIIGVYFLPSWTHFAGGDKIATVMFTVVTPMLNPFIYSLRNKDIKRALGKVKFQGRLLSLGKKCCDLGDCKSWSLPISRG